MAKTLGDGIPIPDVIDPDESMEMTLCIPRNRDHMAAFFGALYQLTVWQSWQEDADHNGTLVAQVWWRYFLSWNRTMNDIDCEDGMAKCCTPNPEIKRFDPETERPQISYDNGATWQSDPSDTSRQIQVLPPIVRAGSTKTKCDAATNAIQHINELITSTAENLTTASDVLALAIGVSEAILGLFLILISAGTLTAPVIAVATAIWAAATGLFNLGIDGYNAYWTTDKQDAIFCKIVCNIGENGQFTEAQYQAFRSGVKEILPASPALDIVMTAINAGGAQGMSQMASYGSWATADCSECCPELEVYSLFPCTPTITTLLEPDEDGVYTLVCDCFISGGGFSGYQGSITFTSDPDVPAGSPVSLISDVVAVSGDPSFAFRLNPERVLVYDFGVAMLYTYRATVPFTLTFKLAT